jgi:acyl carrier protein
MASRDEIFAWVTGVLQQEFQYDGPVGFESHLIDDLDLDSIDAIDMTVRLEEKTGLSFKEEELKSLRTVGDVVDLIDARL